MVCDKVVWKMVCDKVVCVKDGVWQRWCVTKMVCDKVVCDKVVCENWCVTKLCAKDCVWKIVCERDCVCVKKDCVRKIVCERCCVSEQTGGGGGGGGGGAGWYRIKNKNPTQRCGERRNMKKPQGHCAVKSQRPAWNLSGCQPISKTWGPGVRDES